MIEHIIEKLENKSRERIFDRREMFPIDVTICSETLEELRNLQVRNERF